MLCVVWHASFCLLYLLQSQNTLLPKVSEYKNQLKPHNNLILATLELNSLRIA